MRITRLLGYNDWDTDIHLRIPLYSLGIQIFIYEYSYTCWEYRHPSTNIFIPIGNTNIHSQISIYALLPYTFPHCNNPFHPQISEAMTKMSILLGRILPSRMPILYYTFSSILKQSLCFPAPSHETGYSRSSSHPALLSAQEAQPRTRFRSGLPCPGHRTASADGAPS